MRDAKMRSIFTTFSSSPSSSSMLILLIAIILLSYCMAAQSIGEKSEDVKWEILSKRNFSSQIRLNPHLLLMITVPWSGESRSLMKEVAHLVAGKQEELGYLKLMVVFRNSEKMLADALGASEGITLFYYHHSASYKYQGRLRAQNILSSVYRFMVLQTEEVPLKALHTEQDLENFFQSADTIVLLLEFCGWSAKLLHRTNDEDNETVQSVDNHSETVGLFKENLSREAGGRMTFEKMKNQKGLKIEELTCATESVQVDSSLLGGLMWSNQSDSQGMEFRSDGMEMSCTAENFHKFKSFFLEFKKIAREYFLPLERHRFGLISERSLLPFLDVGKLDTWSVVIQFSGCSNCSVVVNEGDSLRNILQTHPPLVKELDTDGGLESVFPANRPSVILFIDRSSDSSKLRGESKSALQALRKFVKDNQLSYQIVRGPDSSTSENISGNNFISDHSFQMSVKDVAPKIVKFKDDMAIMIMNKGKSISLDAAFDSEGNSLHNILANLLHREKHAANTKETKISILAKEVGFQLLSNDFKVQIVDSSPSHNDDSQLININDNVIASMEDQASKPPQESTEDYVLSKEFLFDSNDETPFNDEMQTKHTNTVTPFNDQASKPPQESTEDYVLSNEFLFDSNDKTPFNDEMQTKHTNTETCLLQNQEKLPYRESNINMLTSTSAKELEDGTCTSMGTHVNEDDNSCYKEDLQSCTCHGHAKDYLNLEKESSVVEKSIEEQNIDQTDCSLNKSCSAVLKQSLTDITPGKDLVENDAHDFIKSMKASISDGWHVQKLPFKGSFFFSDGGYQLLTSLTGEAKIPSLVILDPISQHHYVYSEETYISYSSLLNFVDKFLNGSLTPYQRTASPVIQSRDSPRPPFVNLDFHEADSIPRVTADTFCDLIFGYKPCFMGNDLSLSQIQNFRPVWKMDVLVLFSTSWCGFCQRMELIVREVYRAFKHFSIMLKSESKDWDSTHIQDNAQHTVTNGPPSIFLMDCTQNDCGAILKPLSKKELYPLFMLFPAENKSAITYEGGMSVANIVEFLISRGRNSHYLTRHKGFLWIPSWKGSKSSNTLYDKSSLANEGATFSENKYNEILLNTESMGDDHLPIESPTSNNLHKGLDVAAGAILTATDKLLYAIPFVNSTVLIVTADKNQGFQGLIINKRISWDIFNELNLQLEPLKQAPLFYGGPVRAHDYPLVSLVRKAIEGYVKVTANIFFGNPLATRRAIEGIKLGDNSAHEFWFFLGYSSWAWNQLFDELAEGSWFFSESPIGNLDWLDG